MITFLPWSYFPQCARDLDNKRLGKQRVEGYQLLRALKDPNSGWRHHPAVRMWRGHESWLYLYTLIIIREWVARGFKDTLHEKVRREFAADVINARDPPLWLGNEDLHRSHRAALVRKMPEHYGPLYGLLKPEPYVWPV